MSMSTENAMNFIQFKNTLLRKEFQRLHSIKRTRTVQVQREPGSVFTNHSLELSLSYSPEFSMYRSI